MNAFISFIFNRKFKTENDPIKYIDNILKYE